MAVRYEPKGKIALITLDRPDALNTFDRAMHNELHDAWLAFRDDPGLWVAIVTGAGDRAFSAGADIRGFGQQAADERRPAGPSRHLWERVPQRQSRQNIHEPQWTCWPEHHMPWREEDRCHVPLWQGRFWRPTD